MKDSTLNKVVEAATRAETPHILFAADLSLRLQVPEVQVRQAMLADLLGPWMTIDGEPAITRDAFVEHLRLRMGQTRREDRELLPGIGTLLPGPGSAEEECNG
jgi:hypothetical protein